MKHKLIISVFVLAFLLGMLFLFSQTKIFSTITCHEGSVLPIFSPENSGELFNLISSAKYEIKLEVYEFSSKALADSLVKARDNNVSIKVILESSVYANNNMFNYLLNNGIAVSWASKKFHNTHSKFMIIDDSIVFVGSINWSENAIKYNREASVIIYSKEIANSFERIFDMDFGGQLFTFMPMS
jgi:phosphatidylserine/phosphatidylglycerophosphate/cardiolipin synthase-like enzyme